MHTALTKCSNHDQTNHEQGMQCCTFYEHTNTHTPYSYTEVVNMAQSDTRTVQHSVWKLQKKRVEIQEEFLYSSILCHKTLEYWSIVHR